MMEDIDFSFVDRMMEDIKKNRKPRFRYTQSPSKPGEWFWSPANYAAETIHLMETYGHTNIARRFKE